MLFLLGSHSSSFRTALGCPKAKYKGLQEAQEINFTNGNPPGWKGTLLPTVPEPPAPLLCGDTHMILMDEGSLHMIPTTSSARKQQWKWALAPRIGIAQLSFPCHRKPWLRQKPLLCQHRGIHKGDLSHHFVFSDGMGKGRKQGQRSGQLLKCNWCNDSVLQNESLSHLFQATPPIPPTGEGTGLPGRAAGGRSPSPPCSPSWLLSWRIPGPGAGRCLGPRRWPARSPGTDLAAWVAAPGTRQLSPPDTPSARGTAAGRPATSKSSCSPRQSSLPNLHKTKLTEKEKQYPSCTPRWVTSLRPLSKTWGQEVLGREKNPSLPLKKTGVGIK